MTRKKLGVLERGVLYQGNGFGNPEAGLPPIHLELKACQVQGARAQVSIAQEGRFLRRLLANSPE